MSKTKTGSRRPDAVATRAPQAAIPGMEGLAERLAEIPDDDDEEVQTTTALARPAAGPTQATESVNLLDQLARFKSPEAAESLLNIRRAYIEKARAIAIASTVPEDWTLYKDKEGHVVGTLRDSGAVSVRKWMGISITAHRPVINGVAEPKITDDRIEVDGKVRTVEVAEMWANGYCALTGEEVTDVYVGLRSLNEDGRQNFVGRGHLQDLKASCRTTLDTKVVRILSGLRKVSVELLVKGGLDVNKCYLGSGYGNAASRAASSVTGEDMKARQEKLHRDLLRRVGGNMDTYRDLLKELTLWKKDGKDFFARQVSDITQDWKIEKVETALKAHPQFGDAKVGAAPAAGVPEPGTEG